MMFWQQKLQEPPLHQAVLKQDYRVIEALSKNREAQSTTNALGYTAVEIAQLLGNVTCLAILQPNQSKKIKVEQKNKQKAHEFTLDEFSQLFNITYTSHLLFPNYESLKETIYNCPWLLERTLLGEDNRNAG